MGLQLSSSDYPDSGTITAIELTAYSGGEVAVIDGIEWDYQTFVAALSAWSAGNADPMAALFSADGTIKVNATDGNAFRFASNFEDILAAITERVRLVGSAGADVLSGDRDLDTLLSGAGRDTFAGGSGEDHLSGMGGNDVLFGGSEDDTLYGEGGKDALAGGGGDDYLVGGSGSDILRGHSGDDLLDGGDGANYSVSNTYWGFGAHGGAYSADGDDTITHLGDVDFIRIGTQKFTAEQLMDYISSNANREGASIWVKTGQGTGGTDTVILHDLYGATDANTAQTTFNYLFQRNDP